MLTLRDLLTLVAINWMAWLAILFVVLYDLLQESF